jgi:hypothetical protein
MKKILKNKYDLSISKQEDQEEQQKLPTTPPINEYILPINNCYLTGPITGLQNISNINLYPEIQELNSDYPQTSAEFITFNEYESLVYQELYPKNYANQSNNKDYYQENEYNFGHDSDQSDNAQLSRNRIDYDQKKEEQEPEDKSKTAKLDLVYCAFCLHNFKFRTNLVKHIKTKHFEKQMNDMSIKEMEKFIITSKNFNKN